MKLVGTRWRIPKKDDLKGWAEMKEKFERPIVEEVELPTIGHRGVVKPKYSRAEQDRIETDLESV